MSHSGVELVLELTPVQAVQARPLGAGRIVSYSKK